MPRKPLAVVQGNRMQSSKGRPLKKKSYSSNQQQHVGLMSGNSNAASLSKSRSTEAGAVHYKIIACEKENASAENASRHDEHLGFLITKITQCFICRPSCRSGGRTRSRIASWISLEIFRSISWSDHQEAGRIFGSGRELVRKGIQRSPRGWQRR